MVEAVVTVPEDVADAGDVCPRDLGMLGFEVGRHAARRFGHDLDPPLRGEAEPALAEVILERPAGGESLDFPDRLEDVLQAGAGVGERHQSTSSASAWTRCQIRALAQSAGKSEFDRAHEDTGQEALEAREVDQSEPGVRIDLDQEVDIARRPGLTAGSGTEQRQAGDAAPSDVLGVGAQQRNDLLALGVLARGVCFGGTRHGAEMVAQIAVRQIGQDRR